jgi:tRNA(Arg) A34 adenosine deaminase TadA
MNRRMVEICKAVTMTGDGVGKRNSYRVGAILFEKNRVLTAKVNSLKTHPALKRFTQYPYLHAESACILGHGLDYCAGTSMLVLRLHRDNNTLSCAKPCDTCMSMIELAGVRKVWYSDWDGEIRCL